jgi:methylmalonyl-CoA mutase
MTNLFSSFPTQTSAEWETKIIDELKNPDFAETLITQTLEDISVLPFYSKESNLLSDLSPLPKSKTGWEIFTESSKISDLNANEVDGILVDLEKNKPDENYKNLVQFKKIETLTNLNTSNKNILLKLDIYGNLCSTGNWFIDQKSDEIFVRELLEKSNFEKSICIQNSIFQNAGANMIQQLALALSHTNEYIETFGNEIVKHIFYNFSVGNNYFFEVAKLRAFRFLLQSFLESKNIHCEAYIFTESSYRNKSFLDSYNNVIRNTLETSSAVFGGSDAVLIHAHDSFSQEDLSNDFSTELAHKIQLILKKESYLDKFSDPMAGNYYVENITNEMMEKAGILFKKIEKEGGLIEGMKNGSIQKMISISHNKEQEQFDKQKQVLIGVNKFRNTEKKLHSVLFDKKSNSTLFNPILPIRISQKIEYATNQ